MVLMKCLIILLSLKMQVEGNNSNRKVSYFYNPSISKFVYAKQHPMKPQRISMAHSLIVNMGLYRKLDVFYAREASQEEITRFHNEEYISYLSNFVSKDIVTKFSSIGIDRFSFPEVDPVKFLSTRQKFKVGQSTDCPAFNGLYNMCQISAGGSIDCASLLLNGEADIAINWSGGMHHAKKSQASGFCYVNDIVLAILQLLQVYPRVLYVDIDVHHGDGVQEAFYLSNRVMTVSFHQYGQDFFPGTGNIKEIGEYDGKNYSLNIPLKPGITDNCFEQLFKDVMQGVMAKYRPHALVMQLGADSLCYDKLGQFNLSLQGHGNCLKYMLGYGLPTILMGGGGYTIQNVARCWAYETGIALGQQLSGNIPKNDPYYSRYSYDQKLHFAVRTTMQNKNTTDQLNQIRKSAYDILKELDCSPGVQFHNLPSNLSPWANWGEDISESTLDPDIFM